MGCMKSKQTIENEFGKFFYTPTYIKYKNQLFNYRQRIRMIHKTLEKHSDIMAREYNIADIGSGISPVTPDISKTVFIELEKQAVDFLRKQGLNAVKGDITHLSFQKESFDAILCSEVLEHVPNYKKGISEMARVLKKN